ncbi:MAG: c-type cytochrome [Rubrivivax sp.]
MGTLAALFAPPGIAPALGAPASDAAAAARERDQGRELLAQYQCGACHVIPGVAAARGGVGPSLAGFGRRSYIAGTLPNQPATLVRWLVAPASLVPGTPMPSLGVGKADAQAMAAYLASLR